MTHHSLDLIFDGLKPIYNKLTTVAITSLIATPFVIGNPANIAKNTVPQIHSIHSTKMTLQDEKSFNEFASNVIALIDTIVPFFDMTQMLVPQFAYIVSDEQIGILSTKIEEYNTIANKLIAHLPFTENSLIFIEKLKLFSQKMTAFCNMIKSEKYKYQADQAVLARAYQGTQSVGYRFNPNDSFDDFKRALLG